MPTIDAAISQLNPGDLIRFQYYIANTKITPRSVIAKYIESKPGERTIKILSLFMPAEMVKNRTYNKLLLGIVEYDEIRGLERLSSEKLF